MTNLDFGDELQRFNPKTHRDNAGGTWPAKRRLASALRSLIHVMFPTGASESEILEAADWAEQCAERFAAAPAAEDDPKESRSGKPVRRGIFKEWASILLTLHTPTRSDTHWMVFWRVLVA